MDALPVSLSLAIISDAVLSVLHRDPVPFQNPARFQNNLEPGRVLESYFYPGGLCCHCILLCRTFDVLPHFLWIIDRPLLQDRIDDPQKLAGNYYQ